MAKMKLNFNYTETDWLADNPRKYFCDNSLWLTLQWPPTSGTGKIFFDQTSWHCIDNFYGVNIPDKIADSFTHLLVPAQRHDLRNLFKDLSELFSG